MPPGILICTDTFFWHGDALPSTPGEQLAGTREEHVPKIKAEKEETQVHGASLRGHDPIVLHFTGIGFEIPRHLGDPGTSSRANGVKQRTLRNEDVDKCQILLPSLNFKICKWK